MQGGAKALQALLGGSTDVVSGFYDHTIQMAAEGRELVAFVTMLRFPGLVLVTSPQQAAAITQDRGSEGTMLGVTSAGSSSHMLLTYLLQQHGVAGDGVSITAIGTAATAIAAIERGKVDAGMMADPAFTLMMRRNPGARVLADLRQGDGVTAAFGIEDVSGVGAVREGRVDPSPPRHDRAARARHPPHARMDEGAHAAGDRRRGRRPRSAARTPACTSRR